jgi:hypothetical protein
MAQSIGSGVGLMGASSADRRGTKMGSTIKILAPIVVSVGVLVAILGLLPPAQLAAQSEGTTDWLPHTGPVQPGESRILTVSMETRPAVLQEAARKEIQQLKAQGYIEVAEDSVPTNDQILARVQPFEVVASRLGDLRLKQPAYLPTGAVLVGAIPMGPTEEGPWTAVRLIYQLPKEQRLEIAQWNVAADRGWVFQYQELINAEVNGHPAILYPMKTEKAGRMWYELTWGEENIFYGVYGNVTPEELQKVAESLQVTNR